MPASRLVRPSPALSLDAPEPLTVDQVRQWRTEGFVLVDGVLPVSLIDRLAAAAGSHFPDAGSSAADSIRDFGSSVTFPSRVDGVNEVTLHPRLMGAVAQLLGTGADELRLSQSDVWSKYGRIDVDGPYDNQDQRIHFDYPNHTLAHPPPWNRPEAVEMIIYLSDASICGGSTAVVPRAGDDDPAYRWPLVDTPGVGDLRYVNDRVEAERYFATERPRVAEWRQSLYDREVHTSFEPGSIVFYRHDVWHRGTPLIPGTRRLVHNITYRRAECEWISTLHVGWAWSMYRDDKLMERLVAASSLDQRAVLGFPQPGASYWTAETIDAVEARYAMFGFDGSPYRDQL